VGPQARSSSVPHRLRPVPAVSPFPVVPPFPAVPPFQVPAAGPAFAATSGGPVANARSGDGARESERAQAGGLIDWPGTATLTDPRASDLGPRSRAARRVNDDAAIFDLMECKAAPS